MPDHPYHIPSLELAHMTDDELEDYLSLLRTKLPSLKGYGHREYQREITRVEAQLRRTEEDQ